MQNRSIKINPNIHWDACYRSCLRRGAALGQGEASAIIFASVMWDGAERIMLLIEKGTKRGVK